MGCSLLQGVGTAYRQSPVQYRTHAGGTSTLLHQHWTICGAEASHGNVPRIMLRPINRVGVATSVLVQLVVPQ